MPHDMFGQELKPGDVVVLEMTVRDVTPDAEMCNVHLVRKEAGEQELSVLCQAKQLSKMRPLELRATSSPDAPRGPQTFSEQ